MKVIIVGAGLVGTLSSCYFGKRGHEVHVYDYRDDPRISTTDCGRSINLALSKRGQTALAGIGLEDKVLAFASPMKGRMIHSVDGKKRSIPYDPVYKQCIYAIGRKNLNEILVQDTESYKNIFIHFNCKIIAVNVKEAKIVYQRLDGSTDLLIEDYGDLLVGADGAFSSVRKEIIKQPMVSFSQNYIEHGYIELTISSKFSYLMENNHLHIWPRGEFMMIALPNQDSSWTVTLFMPLVKFDDLKKSSDIVSFFKNYFPDALRIIGEEALQKQFSKGPSYLVSIKCSKYHVNSKSVIIGDAAHAIVPFYGQGMNAGFEDCRLLDELIHDRGLDLEQALNEFSRIRTEDTEAIYNFSMYNYIEMRDLVTSSSYLLRKVIDNALYKMLPNSWVPLYQSITFTNIPYHLCEKNKLWQDTVLRNVYHSICVIAGMLIFYLLFIFQFS